MHTQSCCYTHSRSITLKGEDGDILLDYSKNIITENTMKLLFDLVRLQLFTLASCVKFYHIIRHIMEEILLILN